MTAAFSLDEFTRPEIAKSELATVKFLLSKYEGLPDEDKGTYVKSRIADLAAEIQALETELASCNETG